MGKPFDIDLRQRAVAAVEESLWAAQAARRLSVSNAAIGAWVRPSLGPVDDLVVARPAGVTLKKTAHASEQQRPDVRLKREA